VTGEELRQEIRAQRDRLARLEQELQRQDEEAWRQYLRERAEALQRAQRHESLHLSQR
jgi:hypothetical protein